MANQAVNTAQLNVWVDRLRAGDRAAADELPRTVCGRLERLARKMLQRFPDVRRWAETGDLLQNSLVRLLRAPEEVRPGSVRDFFGLAGEQMRRELLDLARRFRGSQGAAAHHESGFTDPPDPSNDANDLDRWTTFHQEVTALPEEEREVVGLIFYHGLTRAAVAELLGIGERTVRRRWESALLKLRFIMRRGP
jgi:RNA polymerase sigma-70 factor (ECF subfamily)